MDNSTMQPHILIFPFPAQSHVTTMLKLAELLCLAGGFHITFLNSTYVQTRLVQNSDIVSRFSLYPGFWFETITDGLPDDHPRCGSRVHEMFHSTKVVTRAMFREMLGSGSGLLGSGSGRGPLSCIIADGVLTFAIDVAEEFGIRCFLFRTVSVACHWAYFCIPRLIEAGELPFRDDDMDVPISNVPGMESFLRRRDLPGFCRSGDVADPTLQFIANESQRSVRADALIFNTFEELESPIFNTFISRNSTRFYGVGPLHTHLKSRLSLITQSPHKISGSNSLWKEDRTCISWLDNQPSRSVIYVSFGSIVVLTRAQFLEFWHGLVNSGKRFLWAIRPDSIPMHENDVYELKSAMGDRGRLVEWAPQEEVLGHSSIGAFLTHGGWNSILESVAEGVPMICWPYYADQYLNARFVSEVWRVGLEMKDRCDRNVVERMVREVLDERVDEFRVSAEKLKKCVRVRVGSEGVSSLDKLIQDLRK